MVYESGDLADKYSRGKRPRSRGMTEAKIVGSQRQLSRQRGGERPGRKLRGKKLRAPHVDQGGWTLATYVVFMRPSCGTGWATTMRSRRGGRFDQ